MISTVLVMETKFIVPEISINIKEGVMGLLRTV